MVTMTRLFLALLLAGVVLSTPLDDYVKKPDPVFAFFDTGQIERKAAVVRHPARVPPAVGLRLDGSQPGVVRVATGALRALQVAGDPPLLKPADVAQLPQRRIDAGRRRNVHALRLQRVLKFGEKPQRMIARVHQRQRQSVRAGTAHQRRIHQVRNRNGGRFDGHARLEGPRIERIGYKV